MKKLLAVLLVLCLFVGMMPMAFAEGSVDTETTGEGGTNTAQPEEETMETLTPADTVADTPVDEPDVGQPTVSAEITSKDEFKDAINNAVVGETITIADDVEISFGDNYTISKTVTIKGGTFTGSAIVIDGDATVTFEGSKITTVIVKDGAKATGLDGYVMATKYDSSEAFNYTYYISANKLDTLGCATIGNGNRVNVYQSVADAIAALGGRGTVNVISNTAENIVVPANVTLYISDNSYVTGNVTVEAGGKVMGETDGVNIDDQNPTTPDPEPDRFTLTFEVYPYWASIALMDDQGQSVTVIGNKATVTEGVTYKYTVSADGFTTVTGEVKVTDDETVKVPLPQSTRVIIWPSSHGYVTYRINDKYDGDLVALFVNPDSGYYLDDLTVKMSGGATFTPYHYEGNVYYFRLHGETATVYATFKALPDEYRVYIANTEHGSVSVDTRYAEEGEWVYITVNPNAGYRLSDLTVTRPSGNTVKVEHVRGNVFRFAMPGVRVTVDAEFVRTTMPFTDVSRGQWFYDAVSFVYWRDIMDGVTSTQFAPDATTTRAMVVQILYRMAGSPTVRGSSPFYDVSNGAWYADAVIWAEANDIVNGMTTTTFAPNTAVTREQLATMLYRYAQYRHYNTSAGANTNILSYYDANHISEYAFSALQWACGEGIMDGTGTGYLSPQGQATRAQLAAMLMRFCMEYRI